MYSREQEIEMIDNPEKWPQHPLLPIKLGRGRGIENNGVIIDQPRIEGKLMIRKGVTMWHSPEDINSAECEWFDSTEALVDAGWMVD